MRAKRRPSRSGRATYYLRRSPTRRSRRSGKPARRSRPTAALDVCTGYSSMLEQAKAQEVGESFRPCAPRRAGTAHAHRMRLPARPLDQLHPTGPDLQGQSGGLVRLRPRHRQQRHTSTRRRHNYGWRCVRAQRSFTGGLTPGGPLAPLPPGPRAQLRRSHPAPLNTTCIRKRSPTHLNYPCTAKCY